jgi:hypothetical protein
LWLYFALLRPFQTLDVLVKVITSDSDTDITEALEVMAVTVDMGMGMVVFIMDMVTMVVTKRLSLLSSNSLKIVKEQVLLQSVFSTSIHLLTHSQNMARDEFSE